MSKASLLLMILLAGGVRAESHGGASSQETIASFLRQEVAAGHVVGAQVLVGGVGSGNERSVNIGTLGPTDQRSVSDDTVFCIASCSKPVAAAAVFSLLDHQVLSLSTPASQWIPAYGSPVTADGINVRSPTLRELLAHRGGIYSQKNRLTKIQLRAIRDFRLSLEESVQMIAKQPLSSPPGTKYAYSGAGYILVGMMAEKASGQAFESVLRKRVCEPLGMASTTYFPVALGLEEIAMGGKSQLVPPHTLGQRHRLPLVGGSLYTTANDLGKFARMVLGQGRLAEEQVMSEVSWQRFVSPAFQTQSYGYGWMLAKQGNRVVTVSHGGSLPPYQAAIRIDLQREQYRIVLWTLAKPGNAQMTSRIRKRIAELMK
ncbi:serine hydrolase domain-containing protein [Crateriforma conspicua]|uniref:Penicillin-binding protein 4 n=1 Tax=Crateriforma conspicua TaxID=2527996 RepID=A0A5C6FXF6_9PLAN|nr:serine hydrolase domain-containing protein [Crateriforma conspicua]TWU66020.1 Penicillin-binding protein 4* [Crateriforma conspicua]